MKKQSIDNFFLTFFQFWNWKQLQPADPSLFCWCSSCNLITVQPQQLYDRVSSWRLDWPWLLDRYRCVTSTSFQRHKWPSTTKKYPEQFCVASHDVICFVGTVSSGNHFLIDPNFPIDNQKLLHQGFEKQHWWQNGSHCMTEHEKLGKEMISRLACIFVGGHSYLLKDVQS